MDLAEFTIASLIRGYKEKKFSVSEVVASYLDRINKLNPELNAFLTINENALNEAEKLNDRDPKLPLFGIPMGVKDMFLTKGVKTTAASKVLENYIPPYSATVVDRLEVAGAISLGKLNCDAWAHGSSGENSDFGNTLNPWNKKYVPGGSSSGSGAAVTASMAAFATGTDTGGSIRLPASFTNTVGLKPTYGLVPRYGIISMASSLDSIGHFTRTVEDSALILNITAGKDGYDSTVADREKEDYMMDLQKDIKKLKIGVPKEYTTNALDKATKEVFEKAVKTLEELGTEIVEISLPHTEYAIATYYIIQPSEVSSNLARFDGIRFGKDRSHFGKEAKRRIMLGTFTLSSGYYDAYYKKAMQVRTLIIDDFKKAFSKASSNSIGVDAIVAPVSPTPPWQFGEKANDPLKMYLSDALTVPVNLAGVPAISVPAGFSHSTGSDQAMLPIGIQFIGPHFSEKLLFQIASNFERQTEFWKQLPKLEL